MYILLTLSDHCDEGTILKGEGVNHPQIKLWYRGEEVLIKKVSFST